MKATKRKSGSWQCRVYHYTDENGKQHYKAFTCDDPTLKGKKKCEAEALAWSLGNKRQKQVKESITFAKAVDAYIEERDGIASPSTIRKYRGMQRNRFAEINDIRIDKITPDHIQRLVTRHARDGYSAHSITDMLGLITGTMKKYEIDIKINPTKPKKKRVEYAIPTDAEMKKIIEKGKVDFLDVASKSDIYLPILIGAFGGLRISEVAAIDASDLSGTTLHVHRNMVYVPGGGWIYKDPKTMAGDRFVELPESVAEMFPKKGRITQYNPAQISYRFRKLMKSTDATYITFHGLRHWNTSVKHDLGIPDVEIMRENGWNDDRVMKSIYRHAMNQKEHASKSARYFNEMMKEDKT